MLRFERQLADKESNTLTDSDDDKKKAKVEIKNALAIHYVTILFKKEEQLCYIRDARTTDY